MARYTGRYDAGPEVLRQQRLEKLRALDLVLAQPTRLQALLGEWQNDVEQTGVILSQSPFQPD